MNRKIKILDTTLRDGEQAPNCSMTYKEKLKFAVQLEKLGVDIIEAGFAATSPGDFKAIKEISKIITSASVASLARAVKKDIDLAYEATKDAVKPRINIFLATSKIHLKYKLKISEEECLSKVTESVAYAATLFKDVEFMAEDAARTSADFLAKVYTAAIQAGAKTIGITDTVGYIMPQEMKDLVAYLIKNVKGIDKVDISVHCHNDLGMGVANTLSGILAGANQAECTINGIGERAGNSSLEEVVMALETRKDIYKCRTNIVKTEIYPSSRMLAKITNIEPSLNKPLVGENAFAHEAGVHQQGVLANRSTYEIMPAETVGCAERPFVLGKHSGKAALQIRLKNIGYNLTKEELEIFFIAYKKFADRKKPITDSELKHLYNIEKIHKSKLDKEKAILEKLKSKEEELKAKELELEAKENLLKSKT
ncbi:MAG: 2-isopropylmalate synthase [Clostridia bacterium]